MSDPILPRILVVDDSRMVRASIVKHLKGHYEVREEADGEAGWQTLVLDLSVVAIISDLQMPKLDGFGLLNRIRSSKLRRLQEMPFILVSGAESEEEMSRAKRLGVSDFITKGIGTTEILARVNNLLELVRTKTCVEDTRKDLVQDSQSGIYTRKYIELQAAQALSHAARHNSEVSVMVLGLDHYDALEEKVGTELAAQVSGRFAQMLSAKMRREDSLGHFEEGQFVIVSPGTSPARCASFADRVREAVQVAHVAVQGKRLKLTVSAGVANAPEDKVVSAGALLELASSRLHEAAQAGGNRIVMGGRGRVPVRALTLQQALDLLRGGHTDVVLPQLAKLGVEIFPLIRLLDAQYGWGLDIEAVAHRLASEPQESDGEK